MRAGKLEMEQKTFVYIFQIFCSVGLKNSLSRVSQVFSLKCAHQINISATEPDFYER